MINITTNAAQIAAKLDEITAALVSNTESCMTNACLAVQAKAMEKCPVNTGELRRSITTEVETNGTTVNGKVGTNVDYAPYVHEGTGIYSRTGSGRKDVPWVYCDAEGNFHKTSGIKPTPFLEDAANEIKPDLASFFSEVLGK